VCVCKFVAVYVMFDVYESHLFSLWCSALLYFCMCILSPFLSYNALSEGCANLLKSPMMMAFLLCLFFHSFISFVVFILVHHVRDIYPKYRKHHVTFLCLL